MALTKNLAPPSSSEARSNEETGSRTGRQLKPTLTESMLRIYYVLSNCGLSFDEKPEIRVSVTRKLGGLGDDPATIEIASLRPLPTTLFSLIQDSFADLPIARLNQCRQRVRETTSTTSRASIYDFSPYLPIRFRHRGTRDSSPRVDA